MLEEGDFMFVARLCVCGCALAFLEVAEMD
jgi:hypothetical protein